MTLIASIITFYNKKILEKKMLPSTLDMEPSSLDPRQKDRLLSSLQTADAFPVVASIMKAQKVFLASDKFATGPAPYKNLTKDFCESLL